MSSSIIVGFELLSTLFSEFVNREEELDDSKMAVFNAAAGAFMDDDAFGDQAEYAKACLIAHLIKISDGRSRGALTSEKVGDEARSYADPSSTGAGAIGSTSYGAMFIELRAARIPPGRFYGPRAG